MGYVLKATVDETKKSLIAIPAFIKAKVIELRIALLELPSF